MGPTTGARVPGAGAGTTPLVPAPLRVPGAAPCPIWPAPLLTVRLLNTVCTPVIRRTRFSSNCRSAWLLTAPLSVTAPLFALICTFRRLCGLIAPGPRARAAAVPVFAAPAAFPAAMPPLSNWARICCVNPRSVAVPALIGAVLVPVPRAPVPPGVAAPRDPLTPVCTPVCGSVTAPPTPPTPGWIPPVAPVPGAVPPMAPVSSATPTPGGTTGLAGDPTPG